MNRQAVSALALVLALVGVALWVYPPLSIADPGEYDRTIVTAVDKNGSTLAVAHVRIADTRTKQRIGLSRTDSLADDEGMLFVHSREADRTYVMRNMSFSIDIIFLDQNGTVRSIYEAPQDSDRSYRDDAKYVLEMNRGWAGDVGLEVGDRVRIPDSI